MKTSSFKRSNDLVTKMF